MLRHRREIVFPSISSHNDWIGNDDREKEKAHTQKLCAVHMNIHCVKFISILNRSGTQFTVLRHYTTKMTDLPSEGRKLLQKSNKVHQFDRFFVFLDMIAEKISLLMSKKTARALKNHTLFDDCVTKLCRNMKEWENTNHELNVMIAWNWISWVDVSNDQHL